MKWDAFVFSGLVCTVLDAAMLKEECLLHTTVWWYAAVVAVSGYVRFPVTVTEGNAFDLEADGFRGDTLFCAKIIY